MTTNPRSLVRRATRLCADRGWEVLRTLQADAAEVRLLVSQSSSHPAELVMRETGDGTVRRTRTEIDALTRAASENVVGLIEVLPVRPTRKGRRVRSARGDRSPGEHEAAPAFLLERPPCGTLETLLDGRRSLRAGEAVTLLLGVAEGLRSLDEAGWTHGSLTARSIGMRSNGCPVVAGLHDAAVVTEGTRSADRAAFRALAERVADALAAQEARRMLAALHMALVARSWNAVVSALLDLSEPEAVLLDDVRADDDTGEKGGAATTGPTGEVGQLRTPPAVPSPFLAAMLDGNPLAEVLAAARQWLERRKKLALIALTPVAAVVLVLAVMPPSEPDEAMTEASTPEPSTTEPSAPEPSATAGPRSGDDSDPTAASPAGESDEAAPDVQSDDPALAGSALLNARHDCFIAERPEASCLDRVIEAGSSLHRSEAAALGSENAVQERDCRGAVLALEQRWGDAALLAVAPGDGDATSADKQPASILMIRTEAGWRLREIYS